MPVNPNLQASPSIYDDQDKAIYKFGSWLNLYDLSYYKGTASRTDDSGAGATLKFEGTFVAVYGSINSLYGSSNTRLVTRYTIDGSTSQTFEGTSLLNQSSQNAINGRAFFQSPALTPGTHNLVIESEGVGAAYILDYILVTPMRSNPSSKLALEVIDDTDPRVSYKHKWQLVNGTKSEVNSTLHRATADGSVAILKFDGIEVTVFGTVNASQGLANVTFSVDGIPDITPSPLVTISPQPTMLYQQTYYQSPVLDPGEHNLTITARSAFPDFLLDFFLVTPSKQAKSSGPTARHTQAINIAVPIAATIGGIIALSFVIWIVTARNRGQRKQKLRTYSPRQRRIDIQSREYDSSLPSPSSTPRTRNHTSNPAARQNSLGTPSFDIHVNPPLPENHPLVGRQNMQMNLPSQLHFNPVQTEAQMNLHTTQVQGHSSALPMAHFVPQTTPGTHLFNPYSPMPPTETSATLVMSEPPTERSMLLSPLDTFQALQPLDQSQSPPQPHFTPGPPATRNSLIPGSPPPPFTPGFPPALTPTPPPQTLTSASSFPPPPSSPGSSRRGHPTGRTVLTPEGTFPLSPPPVYREEE
ncbi:hypothetical protein AX17_001789 [Amanita inopinata Kibby_2008]|nr:hypothetical protein AX17_001789 [Amanita inopinata Kibby_2008]